MNNVYVNRERDWTALVTGTLVVLVGLVLAVAGMASGLRGLVEILAVMSFAAVAYLCGNIRLLCLWCLMLTIPLNLSKYFTTIVNKGSGEMAFRIEICDPFIVALALYLAYDLWTGSRRGIRIPKVAYLWMLVMVMGVITVILGPFRTGPAMELVRMAKVLLLFIVISNELTTPKRFYQCTAAITLGVLMEAVIGIMEYVRKSTLGLDMLGETSSETIKFLAVTSVQSQQVYRVSALLLHPNIFAIFLAALLPLAVGLCLIKIGNINKLFFLGTFFLGLFALIVTLSRSGWVSFAGAFMLFLFLMLAHRHLRTRATMAAVPLLIIALVVGVAFYGQITSRLFDSKEQASVGREVFKEDAKRLIAEKPWFGWGLATYVDNLPPFMKFSREAYGGWLPPVHHIYYLWWAETGLFGLAVQLAILGGLLWVALGNLRVSDELLYIVNAACMASIIAFMIDGFLSFSLRISPILRMFWVLAGMIMAIRYWRIDQAKARAEQQRAGIALQPSLSGGAA